MCAKKIPARKTKAKRAMSAEGKGRIAAAQKKRGAAAKKAAKAATVVDLKNPRS